MGGTSRGQIEEWFHAGRGDARDYLIVACDQFDYGDYPVYAQQWGVEAEVQRLLERELTDVHEVYDLDMDLDDQLAQKRCWSMPNNEEPPPRKGVTLTCGCDITSEMILTAAIRDDNAPVVVCSEHGLTVLHSA